MSGSGIIAVHVGAGSHSSNLKKQYKKVMKNACKEAAMILRNRGSALDAVCCATKTLENSPITNAGNGSSLTMEGTVECDAMVMEGKSLIHGSVGAVSGVQNPILLARRLLEAQKHPLPGGLIPPSFLAGSGARTWALAHDIDVCDADSLITDKSRHIHEESLKYIKQLEEKNGKKFKFDDEKHKEIKSGLLDTVGAVCVDMDGNVASAVSSGGILLKRSGRIGQAAAYGCGCWAQNDFENSNTNIAVSTSGCGEHLIRTMFGKVCAEATLRTDPLGANLASEVQEKFLDSSFLKEVETPMGGSLSMRHDCANSTTDLFWLHTTRSMGVAYMSLQRDHPQASFSELPLDRVGRTVAINCKSFSDGISERSEAEEEDEDDDNEEEYSERVEGHSTQESSATSSKYLKSPTSI